MTTNLFKKRFIGVLIAATAGLTLWAWPPSQASTTPSYRTIHHTLYNFYFPNDPSLTYFQSLKRVIYREVMWYKVKDHEGLKKLFDPLRTLKANVPEKLVHEFEDVFRIGFANVSEERQELFTKALFKEAEPDFRKYLFTLRQNWLYLLYSSPLVEELSGIKTENTHPIYQVDLDLPPSKLMLKDNQIVHQDGDIDYLIIGSGPAGSAIAHELTQNINNARVVIVESGSFIKPLSTITEFDAELMESQNTRRSSSGGLIIRNGATVGGGTTVNIDLAFSPLLPQIKTKLTQWIASGALDATLIHNQPEDWQNLSTAYDWVKKKMQTRAVEMSEVNDNNLLLLHGHPRARTYDLNARKPGADVKVPKVSAVEALIVPALKGGPSFKGTLNLIPNARVTTVIFNQATGDKRATGVKVKFNAALNKENVVQDLNHFSAKPEDEIFIPAKNVILSAGALGSSEVLLRSPIQNDHIGRGIILHPSMGIVGLFDREINVLKGLSASVYAPAPDGGYIFEAMAADPRFIALVHPGSGKDILDTVRNFKKLGGFGIMLVDTVTPTNRIYLSPTTNQVEVDYQLSEQDKERFRQGLLTAVEILLQQGAKYVFIPTAEDLNGSNTFAPFTTKEQAAEGLKNLTFADGLNFISSAHMQGSNKLGPNPKTAVVSPRFKVWNQETSQEISNLYICDSSIFPTSVGANPMQSIYTIAKLFADRLVRDTITTAGR